MNSAGPLHGVLLGVTSVTPRIDWPPSHLRNRAEVCQLRSVLEETLWLLNRMSLLSSSVLYRSVLTMAIAASAGPRDAVGTETSLPT
jgi:hypothetical protein